MSELTKEYFDKQLGKLATKDDIKDVKILVKSEVSRIDSRMARLDTRMDSLETKIENEVADLAGMISRRFDEVEKRLDVRAEVDQLKVQMRKVWDALNIKQQ